MFVAGREVRVVHHIAAVIIGAAIMIRRVDVIARTIKKIFIFRVRENRIHPFVVDCGIRWPGILPEPRAWKRVIAIL